MKSLLFQGVTPFVEPPGCAAIPCRTEVELSIMKDGYLYRFILREQVVPEDSYLVLVKAAAFGIAQRQANNGKSPERSVKDFLIKSTVII